MTYFSPLRYPGGKRRLVPMVKDLIEANNLTNVEYVEPFAGGAAIAWALLDEEYATSVRINDLDRGVYAFWTQALNNTDEICEWIASVDVSMKKWHEYREAYRARDTLSLFDAACATFYMNRTNRSGILAGGVLGGLGQTGKWKVDARFNKPVLINRIRALAKHRNRVVVTNMDAHQFLDAHLPSLRKNSLIFLDPPYVAKGAELYLNEMTEDGHRKIAKRIMRSKRRWLVTYDIAAEEKQLFPGFRPLEFGLTYSAQARYEGREVLYMSPRLRQPDNWPVNDHEFTISRTRHVAVKARNQIT